jgi:hypothetical protein
MSPDADDGRKALVARDEQGLMPDQRLLLNAISETGDIGEALKVTKISRPRFRRWAREDSSFIQAYDAAMGSVTEAARRQLEALSGDAADLAEELLGKMKIVRKRVTCPHCKEQHPIEVEVVDAEMRFKVMQMILKGTGVVKDTKHIEARGELIVSELGDRLALAALEYGKPIAENRRRRLIQLGLITERGEVKQEPPEDVIDVEAEEVPNDPKVD